MTGQKGLQNPLAAVQVYFFSRNLSFFLGSALSHWSQLSAFYNKKLPVWLPAHPRVIWSCFLHPITLPQPGDTKVSVPVSQTASDQRLVAMSDGQRTSNVYCVACSDPRIERNLPELWNLSGFKHPKQGASLAA